MQHNVHIIPLQGDLLSHSLDSTANLLNELSHWQRCIPAHYEISGILLVSYPGLCIEAEAAPLEYSSIPAVSPLCTVMMPGYF